MSEKKHRKHAAVRILGWVLVLLAALIPIAAVSVPVIMYRGGRSLQDKSKGSVPDLRLETLESAPGEESQQAGAMAGGGEDTPESRDEDAPVIEWKADWISYQGKIYDYNENIMTFLIMGIDKQTEVEETEGNRGGQSDTMFLVAVNPDREVIDFISVNRDTMTDIYMYGYEDENGETPVTTAQITTQHGFGDGKELSCQYTCEAVSSLFYDIPINGYAALNMAGITILNDAVGGVDVTVLEDLTKCNPDWVEGAEVHLEGKDSYDYVHWRDVGSFESARRRQERQKQYLKAFEKKLKKAIQEDVTVPVTIFTRLSKYIVTDLTLNEIAYMAAKWSGYSLGNMYSMKGTTLMGNKHEEFFPDYDALRELVLEVFYDEVQI